MRNFAHTWKTPLRDGDKILHVGIIQYIILDYVLSTQLLVTIG